MPFDPAIADAVVDWLSQGKSLKSFCEQHSEAPSTTTIVNWAIEDVAGFAERYRRARRAGVESWADQIVDLSDASRAAAGDMALMQSYKLSVDSRKWLSSKLLPDQYGERLQVTQTGGTATVNIFLPRKGNPGDSARVIEGSARAIEDGSEDE
jgi:hypothetical protein